MTLEVEFKVKSEAPMKMSKEFIHGQNEALKGTYQLHNFAKGQTNRKLVWSKQ
jgi:hypothetical protein